jgi:hypothetical protein
MKHAERWTDRHCDSMPKIQKPQNLGITEMSQKCLLPCNVTRNICIHGNGHINHCPVAGEYSAASAVCNNAIKGACYPSLQPRNAVCEDRMPKIQAREI